MALVEKTTLDDTALRISEATGRDFLALLKPRVMSLVVFTAFVGLMTAPVAVNPLIGLVAILAIAVGAGASGALNMWYDADIDTVMSRTRSRPVPSGKIAPGEALAFGIILSGFSVITLGLVANWFAAAFLAFTIFFYSVVYTMWLKRSTPQNIVIGGAAGAFPPMIGWAVATGGVSVESFVLFLIIFLWTPPHFWALALFKSDDYERAGVPMMPNARGVPTTKRQILVYSVLVAAAGILPWLIGSAGFGYGLVAAVLGLVFVWYAWKVARLGDEEAALRSARALFAYSILYLFAIFAALLVDSLFARIGMAAW